jgi:hypothetical protein
LRANAHYFISKMIQHFHLYTATQQHFAIKGCPPRTCKEFTVPSGATVASNMTVPSKHILPAMLGQTGGSGC